MRTSVQERSAQKIQDRRGLSDTAAGSLPDGIAQSWKGRLVGYNPAPGRIPPAPVLSPAGLRGLICITPRRRTSARRVNLIAQSVTMRAARRVESTRFQRWYRQGDPLRIPAPQLPEPGPDPRTGQNPARRGWSAPQSKVI